MRINVKMWNNSALSVAECDVNAESHSKHNRWCTGC